MVRNFLPLASLLITLGTAPALAEDTALTTRAEAAAAKACGPVQVYDGPPRLFYPQMYKAQNEACIRMVSHIALAKMAAVQADMPQLAQN